MIIKSGEIDSYVLKRLQVEEADENINSNWSVIIYTGDSEYDASGFENRDEAFEYIVETLIEGSSWEIYGLYNNKQPVNFKINIEIV